MSISYEEALATLEAMFEAPWERENLDAVLRNQNGHMENTVDLILRHGDGTPEALVEQLQSGISPTDANIEMDAALARQLSGQTNNTNREGAVASAPTVPAANASATPEDQIEADARLARMLQDELFSEELANNPDFRHLAGGRARNSAASRGRISDARPPARNTAGAVPNSPNVLEKLSELGDNAKRRLQLLAAQFNAKKDANSGMASTGVEESEARGLLDDDNDDLELSARKDL